MQINFSLPNPTVDAKASSSYSLDLIDTRLAKLRDADPSEEVLRELEYLTDLRERTVAEQ